MSKATAAVARCANPGCDRQVVARGYCMTHYRRILRKKDPDAPDRFVRGAVALPMVRVPPEIAEALQAVAESEGISSYQMIRDLLYAWYTNYLRTNPQNR